MLKSVYDPQGKNTDVFKYVDDKIADIDIPTPENIVTVPGGGQLEMSESLGSGPMRVREAAFPHLMWITATPPAVWRQLMFRGLLMSWRGVLQAV